jgi:SAM-dependent methyltransferase
MDERALRAISESGHAGAMPYDPTTYLGAAEHYRYGRPPYSPLLEQVLSEELGLDGDGRLLEVGCGPGVLSVRLATFFEAVVGVDPDGDMLTEGRRAAAEKGVNNICWVLALAEDLPEAAPGPYRLVTFGQPSIGPTRLEWQKASTTCWKMVGRSRSSSTRWKEGRGQGVRGLRRFPTTRS